MPDSVFQRTHLGPSLLRDIFEDFLDEEAVRLQDSIEWWKRYYQSLSAQQQEIPRAPQRLADSSAEAPSGGGLYPRRQNPVGLSAALTQRQRSQSPTSPAIMSKAGAQETASGSGLAGYTQPTVENQRQPAAVDIIDRVRETQTYKNAGGNERAQMLFDAVVKQYGHSVAVLALAAFSESRQAKDDFETFSVGSEREGVNTGKSAARHFFWSAFLGLTGNRDLAETLGYMKEIYDLVGKPLRLPRAGEFDVKDLDTNAAGRNLGLHIWQIWRTKGDRTAHLDISKFTRIPY